MADHVPSEAGLFGMYPITRLTAAASWGLGPLLVSVCLLVVQILKEPTCCNLWPIGLALVLFMSLSAVLIGAAVGRLVALFDPPSPVYMALLIIGLFLGASAPAKEAAEEREEWQTYARSCVNQSGHGHEVYVDVCRYHDQYDSLQSCHLRNVAAAYALRKAGRDAVNAYMQPIKPAGCR